MLKQQRSYYEYFKKEIEIIKRALSKDS